MKRRRRREDEEENVAFELYTAEERHFFRSADRGVRLRIISLEQRIFELNDAQTPLRFRLLLSHLDEKVKAVAMRRIESACDSSSFHKTQQWVEALCDLPIGKYNNLPVSRNAPQAEIAKYIGGMRKSLDDAVYGHAETKGHIVRLLAQWITNPKAKGLVLGIHGPPGVGKTQLCRAVCDVLGLPFAFVPLGGANDGSYLDGHSFTYEGSMWGKIADVLMKSKCMNPVMFFDELDKVSDSRRGEEVINNLIHLTDATQNDKFNDKYFLDVEMDVSKSLMVFSYNDETRINPILRDRMTCLRIEGYSVQDKIQLVHRHLLPAVLAEFALPRNFLTMEDDDLRYVVSRLDEEQGVRGLKRALHDVVSHLNYERVTGALPPGKAPKVDRSVIDKYVRFPKESSSSLAMRHMYL